VKTYVNNTQERKRKANRAKKVKGRKILLARKVHKQTKAEKKMSAGSRCWEKKAEWGVGSRGGEQQSDAMKRTYLKQGDTRHRLKKSTDITKVDVDKRGVVGEKDETHQTFFWPAAGGA